jgi:glycosyltransferase involved in cell wall biosynthesis
VSCLCLTRNRRRWLTQAIRCFQAQTYPNRELLILSSGEDVRDLAGNDASIRIVHIDAEGRTIGELRNFGAGKARGGVVAHWDDDDWSAPGRLEDQVGRLRESGKAVTGYSSMLFTDGRRWWRYEGARNYALGTSLCYSRDWWRSHRFPAMQIGEDGVFVQAASVGRQLETAPAGELMVATVHIGNTSPRRLDSDEWKALTDFPGIAGMGVI